MANVNYSTPGNTGNPGAPPAVQAEPILLEVDHLMFLITVCRGLEQALPAPPGYNLQDRFMVASGSNPPLRINSLDYWGKWGQRIIIEHEDGRRYLMVVPTFAELSYLFRAPPYQHMARLFFHDYTTFFQGVSNRLGLGDKWQGTIDHFDRFTPEEKEQAISFVRRNSALEMMHYSFSLHMIDENKACLERDPGNVMATFWRDELTRAYERKADAEREIPAQVDLLNRYFWGAGEIPGPDTGIVIGPFLPPGVKLRRPPGEAAPREEERPPRADAPAAPLAVPVRGPTLYKGFGCTYWFSPEIVFGQSEHVNTAFFLEGQDGTRYALIDTTRDEHASYMFVVSRPGHEAAFPPHQWILDAQLTRLVLRDEGARTFFRRCIHNEEFGDILRWILKGGPEVQGMLDRLEGGERPLRWPSRRN